MKEISVKDLKSKMDAGDEFQLIDIREQYEVEMAEIGGEHIPMGEVLANLDKIRKDVPVVIHCRSGNRSGNMVMYLDAQGYENLYNLSGGIIAWAQEIDNSLTVQ